MNGGNIRAFLSTLTTREWKPKVPHKPFQFFANKMPFPIVIYQFSPSFFIKILQHSIHSVCKNVRKESHDRIFIHLNKVLITFTLYNYNSRELDNSVGVSTSFSSEIAYKYK